MSRSRFKVFINKPQRLDYMYNGSITVSVHIRGFVIEQYLQTMFSIIRWDSNTVVADCCLCTCTYCKSSINPLL